jgi:hypothetical protein
MSLAVNTLTECGTSGTVVQLNQTVSLVRCSEHESSLSLTQITQCDSNSQSKAIPVTGCGGQEGCEMLRIPHCLDNWLTHGLRSTPQKHYSSASGTHFC